MKPLRQILGLTYSVLLFMPAISAGPLPEQFDAADKYSIVLDLVFPDHWDQCRGAEYLSFGTPQITIRILPGLSQESQIFICRVEKGGFFVVSSTLDQKEGSVWGHTQVQRRIDDRSSVQEENPESAEKIAASIHPIHKSCSIDSRVVEGWFRRLARVRMSLPRLGGGTDGTFYELTLEHGMDRMRAEIWVESGQQKPLVHLVDSIYRQIERSNCTEIQRIPKKAERICSVANP